MESTDIFSTIVPTIIRVHVTYDLTESGLSIVKNKKHVRHLEKKATGIVIFGE